MKGVIMKKIKINTTELSKLMKSSIGIVLVVSSLTLPLNGCGNSNEQLKTNEEQTNTTISSAPQSEVQSETISNEQIMQLNEKYNYKTMNPRETLDAINNEFKKVNQTSSVLPEYYDISVFGYVSGTFANGSSENNERGDVYSAVGMIALSDLKEDGKFSDYWYNMVRDEAMNEIFINEVLLPVEQAYTSNDFSTLMSKMNAYDGKTDNHWNNVTISMLHHIMRNSQNINNEDKQKIEKYFEDLYYQYYDGTLFSLNENQVARRA